MKMCQNTPPALLGGMNGLSSPLGGEDRVRGKGSYDYPHLNPPIKGEESFLRIRCPAALLRGTSLDV